MIEILYDEVLEYNNRLIIPYLYNYEKKYLLYKNNNLYNYKLNVSCFYILSNRIYIKNKQKIDLLLKDLLTFYDNRFNYIGNIYSYLNNLFLICYKKDFYAINLNMPNQIINDIIFIKYIINMKNGEYKLNVLDKIDFNYILNKN